ncbi:MAG TPA: PAS domain-containing protein [Stellaceae bacterium]|nr:PAS domain-containing protein [Stellaceae bacterium]
MERVECVLAPDAVLPPCDARIDELHRYWRSISPGPGLLPGRQHFDPLAIPRLLRWLWLLDVQRDPLRFRYRLFGTEQVLIIGRDLTGKWIDEEFPGFVCTSAFAHFVAAAEHGKVCYRSGFPVLHVPKDFMKFERIFLPMAKNGRDVDMLLALSLYRPTIQASAEPPAQQRRAAAGAC